MSALDVRHLVPADTTKSQWLQNLLGPAGNACRFEKGLPGVDLAPLPSPDGRYGGEVPRLNWRWCVTISCSSPLWRKSDILRIYLHECAHLLVFGQERERDVFTQAHGPIFFLIQLVLFHRTDLAGERANAILRTANLYDYHDSPFSESDSLPDWKWRSAVLGFALKHYQRLAVSELSAEKVAAEAFDLWILEEQRLREDQERGGTKLAVLRARVAELERQRKLAIVWGWRFLSALGLLVCCAVLLMLVTLHS